jgi:hypothetical protein
VAGESPIFRLADGIRELRQDLGRATAGRGGKDPGQGRRPARDAGRAGGRRHARARSRYRGANLQVLDGCLRVQADSDAWELAAGGLVALGHNLREPVRAIERSAFLVTVAGPEGAGAWGQEARAGHL